MHTASRHGHILMVQALLEEGGDPVCQSKVIEYKVPLREGTPFVFVHSLRPSSV